MRLTCLAELSDFVYSFFFSYVLLRVESDILINPYKTFDDHHRFSSSF